MLVSRAGRRRCAPASNRSRCNPQPNFRGTHHCTLAVCTQRKANRRKAGGDEATAGAPASSTSNDSDPLDASGAPVYSRGGAAATALLVGAAVWAGMTALQKWRGEGSTSNGGDEAPTRAVRNGAPSSSTPPPLRAAPQTPRTSQTATKRKPSTKRTKKKPKKRKAKKSAAPKHPRSRL